MDKTTDLTKVTTEELNDLYITDGHKFVELLCNEITIDNFAIGYGEPGYEQGFPDNSILLADWHDVPETLMDFISYHYDVEWSDNCALDDEDMLVYRIQPDSYGWACSYVIIGDEFVGCKRLLDNEELQKEYIEECLKNNPESVNTIEGMEGIFEKHGFVNIDTQYEVGWYRVNDSPQQIYDTIKEKNNHNIDIIFNLTGVGQFSTNFEIWVRE